MLFNSLIYIKIEIESIWEINYFYIRTKYKHIFLEYEQNTRT